MKPSASSFAIEEWLNNLPLRLKPQARRDALALYSEWRDDAPHSVTVAPENAPGASVVLMVQLSAESDNHLIVALDRSTATLVMREQKLHSPKLQSLDPLQLGTLMLDHESGYHEAANGYGTYHHSPTSAWLKQMSLQAADSAYETLETKLGTALGISKQPFRWYNQTTLGYEFEELRQHVHKVEARRIHGVVNQFLGTLDSRALSILRQADYFHPNFYPLTAYQWLTGHTTKYDREVWKDIVLPAATADAVRNRQDFASLYPGLLPLFCSYRPGSEETTADLDAGISRAQVLADHLLGERTTPTPSLPLEFTRWLRGKRRQEFDGLKQEANPTILNMPNAFELAAALPVSWRPKDSTGWRGFLKASYGVNDLSRLLDQPVAQTTLELAKIFNSAEGFPNRILDLGQTIQESFTLNGKNNRLKITQQSNLSDFATATAVQIIIPAIVQSAQMQGLPFPAQLDDWSDCNPLHHGHMSGRLSHLMYRGLTLNKLFNQAERWHKRTNRLQTRANHLEGDYFWPKLVGEAITSPAGIQLQCRNRTSELIATGILMDNCVGGYTHKCVLGNSHIFALRNPATAEQALLEVLEHDQQIAFGQLESPGNQKNVPDWTKNAADWLITAVNSKAIPVAWTLNHQMRQLMRDELGKDMLTMTTGFDPANPERARNAYQAWHYEMSGLFPEPDLDSYLSRTGITAALAEEMRDYAAEQKRQPL